MKVSKHAIRRYRERVRKVKKSEALGEIKVIYHKGKMMKGVAKDNAWIIFKEHIIVVRNDVVVTVLGKENDLF